MENFRQFYAMAKSIVGPKIKKWVKFGVRKKVPFRNTVTYRERFKALRSPHETQLEDD